jgi:RNA polymerase sigma-70 factor, ECF subfamily
VSRFTAAASLQGDSLDDVCHDVGDTQQQCAYDNRNRNVILHQFLLHVDLWRKPVEELVAQQEQDDADQAINGRHQWSWPEEMGREVAILSEEKVHRACLSGKEKANLEQRNLGNTLGSVRPLIIPKRSTSRDHQLPGVGVAFDRLTKGTLTDPSNRWAKDCAGPRKYIIVGAAEPNLDEATVPDDEINLIAALKRREPVAWNTVVDRHLGEVYSFAFNLCGCDRAVAEELAQETWLAAIDGIERCDAERGTFRNWLLGISRRRVALHFRQLMARKNTVPLDERTEETVDLENAALLPEDVLEQVDRAAAVRAALLVLADDRRAALQYKYLEGLSVEATAVRLGRTTKGVESLLTRARGQMRSLLYHYVAAHDGRQGPIRRMDDEQSR